MPKNSFIQAVECEMEWLEERKDASQTAKLDWEDWLDTFQICQDFEDSRSKMEEFQRNGYESNEEIWTESMRRERYRDGIEELESRYRRYKREQHQPQT